MDNVTAIAIINKKGGGAKYPHLAKLGKEIWQYCESKKLSLFASYINTKANIEADRESRSKNADAEYELHQDAYDQICSRLGTPNIDLFASQLNTKCITYVSWKPDPNSIEVDAFTLPWSDLKFSAFPPFCLILKVLHKIITDKAEGIVVVPRWETQPWFPLFYKLLISEEIIFGPNKNPLSNPFRNEHPFGKNLSLVAGFLSGKAIREENFPLQPSTPYLDRFGPPL